MTASSTPVSQGFTGRHMWMVMIGFFGVVIAVNVGLAVVSARTWTGLVVENSYVASQEFEGLRIAHEKQIAAGWTPTFTYAPGDVRLSVVDGKGKPVDLGVVRIQVNRPVGGHDDQTATFERQNNGDYVAALTIGAGIWEAAITADDTPLGPFERFERFRVTEAAE